MTPRHLRSLAPVMILAVSVVVLTACGSSGGGTSSSSPSPTGPGTPGTVASGRALWASPKLVDSIVAGQLNGDMKAVKAVTVKSEDAKGFYFVGIKFTDSSGEHVGVWATKSLDGSTLVWSVNDVARNATEFPYSNAVAGEKLTMATDGAQEAATAAQ